MEILRKIRNFQAETAAAGKEKIKNNALITLNASTFLHH